MHCLRRKLGSLQSLVTVFTEQPDADVVDRAVKASLGLGNIAFCADVEALEQEVLPPEDPETREAVEEIRSQLEKARQRHKVGKYKAALAILKEAEPRVEALQYPPLRAELSLLNGLSREELGQYEEAEAALQEALQSGLTWKQWDLALRAAQALTYIVGSKIQRHGEGLAYSHVALGLSQGLDDEREALSSMSLGNVLFKQGEYEGAEAEHRRALALLEKALGPDHPDVARSRSNLGNTLFAQGRYGEGETEYRHALAIWEKTLGPDHSGVGVPRNNLGNVLLKRGKYKEAEAEYRRAVVLKEKSLGPDHPLVASSTNNLGLALFYQGKNEEAEMQLRRALALKETKLGPDHQDVASSRVGLGAVLMTQGKYVAAEVQYRRALSTVEKAVGPDHPSVAWVLSSLGDVYWATQKHAQAKDHYSQALSVCEKKTCEPEPEARAKFGIARALGREGKAHERALRLARQAWQGYAKVHEKKGLEEVETWLKKRGVTKEEINQTRKGP